MTSAFTNHFKLRSPLWNLPLTNFDDRAELFADIVSKWMAEQATEFTASNKIRFLEIGVWKAGNIANIYERLGNIFEYIGIDPYGELVNDPYKGMFWKNTSEADEVYRSSKKIFDDLQASLYRTTSDDFFSKDDSFFDVIFIDGDHSFQPTLNDLRHALQRLRSGGLMIVDDVGNNFHPEVEWAVRQFIIENDESLSGKGCHPLFFQLPGMPVPVMLQLVCFRKK